MYKQYFGFSDTPFSIAPDPRYLYLSDRHREALAHLIYGVGDQGGFVLLTGEVGTGKTTICRSLLQQLPPKTDVAYIVNPKQTINQLLISITTDFGIFFDEDDTSKDLIDHLNRYLLRSHAEGRNAVLIIDEAQNLSVEVLEQLRLLTNLETNEKKLLQLVLLGQPELNDLLARKELRQLEQRVTARFHLKPLSKTEVAHYIEHRLSVAGSREQLFSPSAITKIYKASEGIPRLINKICDRCLLGIYSLDQSQVSRKIVVSAVKELSSNTSLSIKPRYTKWLAVALLVAVLVAIGIFSLDSVELADNKGESNAEIVQPQTSTNQALLVKDNGLQSAEVLPGGEPQKESKLILSIYDQGEAVVSLQRLLAMVDVEYAKKLSGNMEYAQSYMFREEIPSKLGRLYTHGLHYSPVMFSGVYDESLQSAIARMQLHFSLPVKRSVDALLISRLNDFATSATVPLVSVVANTGSEG